MKTLHPIGSLTGRFAVARLPPALDSGQTLFAGKAASESVFFERKSNIDEFEAEALPHWNDLYRTALSQLKDEALAEDVLQEAYLKAWKSFHQFRKGSNCRAWLFRIMFNCIHDHHRQWFSTKTVNEPGEGMEGHFPYAPPIPDGLTDEDVVAAVQGLAANYREVVLLADVEEFSYKEIAEVLNLPMGTVMSRLSRARKQLRTSLARALGLLQRREEVQIHQRSREQRRALCGVPSTRNRPARGCRSRHLHHGFESGGFAVTSPCRQHRSDLMGIPSIRIRTSIICVIFATWAVGLVTAADPPEHSTLRPVVRGTRHAVSSRTPQAIEVAQNILRSGGNAFDAAVAGQAVLCVTDPASNGVGGDAFILIYDAMAGKVLSINGGGPAPRLATIEWYRKNNDGKLPIDESLLAGTVPGTVDLWYTMLDRWGTMTFAEVLRPAIELAKKGFPIGERPARGISKVEKFKKYPTTAKIYHPNGKALAPGEVFRNPGLARTLQRLVEAEAEKSSAGRREGLKAARDRFYKGDIAREMAAFSEANGGLFRYDDFASYQVKIEEPVSYNYRGYEVYKNPSANQGPSELFALSILEGFDLKAMGHNSAEYIHVNVEAIKLAFADREKFLADQDFVSIPFRTLLSPEYVAERRGLVNRRRASPQLRPGNPEKFDSSLEPVHRTIEATATDGDHKGDTSYIAVVDSKRNAVSWTPSLHSSWGTGVVMGELGFSLNCRGDYFWLDENHANSLETGKRPRSTLTPTLVLKDGKPFMAVGSPGGDDQCMRILQTFLNVVEFDMNIQAAIEAPRWSTEAFPSSIFPHGTKKLHLSVEDRVPNPVRNQLRKRGHKLEVNGPWTMSATSAIVVDPETRVLSAGADPRGDNYALAW